MTARVRTSSSSPVAGRGEQRPRPPGRVAEALARTRVTATGRGIRRQRGPGDRQRVAGVVLHAVVVEERRRAAGPGAASGATLERLGDQTPMPATVVTGAQQVVQRQAGVVERPGGRTAGRRSGTAAAPASRGAGRAQEPAALRERLADQPDPELLEVAQAAVDEPGRRDDVPDAMSSCSTSATRRPRDVASSSAPPDDAAADDEHVPGPSARRPRSAGRRSSEPIRRGVAPGAVTARRRRSVARDPPQQPARADDQDHDQDRRLEDRRLDRLGRKPVSAAAPSTTTTTPTATRTTCGQPGSRPGASGSATVRLGGIPIGATSTRPASARPSRRAARSSAGGSDRQVGPTAGSEGSPQVRSTAVGVSTARTGTPARAPGR